MSHFYGSMQGNRGSTTRGGSKDSGLETTAAGWQGAVRTKVWQNQAGDDYFLVDLIPWKGSGGTAITLSMGRLDSNNTKQPNIQSLTRMINAVVAQAESLRN